MEEILILIVAIITGISTYIISCVLKKGTVAASAIITLLSGIIFPHLFPDIGGVLATVGACASYAGMIEAKRISGIAEMAMVSVLTGSIFIIVSSAYIGIGGRLGSIAAIACFVWLGLKSIYGRIKRKTN